MSEPDERALLAGALKNYLEDLRDSGVDELPYGSVPTHLAPPAKAEELTAAPALQVITTEANSEPHLKVKETLTDIRSDLGDCRRCKLCNSRKSIVFGVGNPAARVLFVGEAPGKDEDIQGEPFVGEAGQLLTRIITRMGLTRDEVYICNILKCRPPDNRDPEEDEVEQCHPFMLRQVKSIAPDVIVALGKFAAQTLLKTSVTISQLRGTFHDYDDIPLMPTFHPSHLLYNKKDTDLFWLVWDDMVEVLKKLAMPVPEVQRKGR